MASRAIRFHCLTAIAVTALTFALAPAAPAFADDTPAYRMKRMHKPMHRWHAPAPRVRTIYRTRVVHDVRPVERVRTRTICYDYAGQPFDCRSPAPVAQPMAEPVSYGCGGCDAAPVVQPAARPVVEYVHYIQPIVRYERTAAPYYAPATGCGGCASYVVQQWPGYSSGCGGCGLTAATPYIGGWGYRRYGYGYGYRGYGYGGYGYGYAGYGYR